MADTSLHGNGVRLVNTKDGIHLEIERVANGSGEVKCHVYTISDAQMNIMEKQLKDVQYLKSYNISIWTRRPYCRADEFRENEISCRPASQFLQGKV